MAAFVAGGAVTGTVGWSGHPLAFAFGIALPALWAFAPSRTVAALVALAHFLGASRGLPEGASNFFGAQLAIGLGLWVAASLMFVAVHAALWTPRGGWHRPLCFAIVAVLMSVPPFGIVGWAHPITAAGILFPGWAWFGLAVTFVLLLAMTTRAWPVAAGIATLAFALSASSWTPPRAPDGWNGIDTAFRFERAGQQADFAQQLATIRMVKTAAGEGARVAVLPESAMGFWTATTERLWSDELAGVDIAVIGAGALVDPDGYDNVMVGLEQFQEKWEPVFRPELRRNHRSGQGARILYRERMPVPVSMWQPWSTGGAHAHFFANPVYEFAGLTVAPLICYEQLIVWPVIQSMVFSPDVLVATGNAWWTGGTNIVAIQRASAEAWASLFGIPLVMAFNEPGGRND
ncbi:conjugal transfer protein TraB [Pelagibacterium halotolerans]|uniref:conjugal transfer protein TraB n=1 Tax=Pelagibacterium halotolerans TaxID=531813 RepID=UPI00384F5FA0